MIDDDDSRDGSWDVIVDFLSIGNFFDNVQKKLFGLVSVYLLRYYDFSGTCYGFEKAESVTLDSLKAPSRLCSTDLLGSGWRTPTFPDTTTTLALSAHYPLEV